MKKRWIIIFCGLLCILIGCERLVFVRDNSGIKHIYRMESDGDAQIPLSPTTTTIYNYPDVSEDGNKIAYTDGQNVFTSDLNDIGGVSQNQLAVLSGGKTTVRWASMHPVVAYANFTNGTAAIFLSATDGSGANPLQVTYPSGSQSDGFGHDFYVDNNVQNIVYSRDGDLYYMFYNGTQPANRITNTATFRETLPVVSHDGQLLAYRVSYQLAAYGTLDRIQIVDVVTWSSRNSIALQPPVVWGSISAIAFSCDDERLYVAARTDATAASREIFSVKLDGSDQLQLTQNTVFDSNPDAIPSPCP